jgi:hypothetical protein
MRLRQYLKPCGKLNRDLLIARFERLYPGELALKN